LVQWLHTRIAGWIETIYPHLQREESKVEIKRMEDDFKFMMLEVCGKAIIKELFSIIIGEFFVWYFTVSGLWALILNTFYYRIP